MDTFCVTGPFDEESKIQLAKMDAEWFEDGSCNVSIDSSESDDFIDFCEDHNLKCEMV